MPRIEFTPHTQTQIKPVSRSIEYFASNYRPGYSGSLGLRVSPKNKRTWFIRYRLAGTDRQQKINIGIYPDLSFKQACTVADDRLKEISEGRNPRAEKIDRIKAPTVKDLWEVYREQRDNMATPKAESTISLEDMRWDKEIEPVIGNTRVEDISPSMLADILDKKAKSAPVSANRLYSFLKILFKPALRKGWITVHPLQWVDKPGGKETTRSRVLEDEEIRKLWSHFDLERPNPRDLFKLGLLTAQRPGELMKMRWDEIDFDQEVWENNVTKTKTINVVPLSPQVINILSGRKQNFSEKKVESEWVFYSAYNRSRKGSQKTPRTKSTKKARARVCEASGVEGWTAHDLRRTARTIMSRLQIAPHVRERVLAHSIGKIEGTYDRYDYLPEKRDALNRLANEIDKILGIKRHKNKIVKLKTVGG